MDISYWEEAKTMDVDIEDDIFKTPGDVEEQGNILEETLRDEFEELSENVQPNRQENIIIFPYTLPLDGYPCENFINIKHMNEKLHRITLARLSDRRGQIIDTIERIIVKFIKDMTLYGNAHLKIPTKCYQLINECYMPYPYYQCRHRFISFRKERSRSHLTIILYLLAKIYSYLLNNITCTIRELYYNNIGLCGNQRRLERVTRDVGKILNTPTWEMGILSSTKGIMAGSLTVIMNDHNIIECRINNSTTLLPQNFMEIERIKTEAKFVLVVEKHTVFEKLLALKIFENVGTDMILISGKGFPDVNTRLMVHRLGCLHRLPVYVLVDADPFGIEIMFVYRYGSKALIDHADKLACPYVRWIGIHPSELVMLNIPTMPLTKADRKKLDALIRTPYISSNIRQELQILRSLQCKAEIENISHFSTHFLINDYITNKINRNLLF